MKYIATRTNVTLLVVALMSAVFGCAKGTPLETEFRDLTTAVQTYCNTPANQRSPEVKDDLFERLKAFDAELTNAPAETRLRYHDRVANQRCFLEMAR